MRAHAALDVLLVRVGSLDVPENVKTRLGHGRVSRLEEGRMLTVLLLLEHLHLLQLLHLRQYHLLVLLL